MQLISGLQLAEGEEAVPQVPQVPQVVPQVETDIDAFDSTQLQELASNTKTHFKIRGRFAGHFPEKSLYPSILHIQKK